MYFKKILWRCWDEEWVCREWDGHQGVGLGEIRWQERDNVIYATYFQLFFSFLKNLFCYKKEKYFDQSNMKKLENIFKKVFFLRTKYTLGTLYVRVVMLYTMLPTI